MNKSDMQLKTDVEDELQWEPKVNAAQIGVSAPKRRRRNLAGVLGVSNQISIKPRASAAQVKEKVEAALLRQATADAKSIRVEASGSTVTLSGQASSWRAVDDAAAAAWAVPGVTQVIDKLSVDTL